MSRTVVDLRDDLMRKAKVLTGLTKKVEIVNLALERLIQQKELEELLSLKGTVRWEGDLRRMRRNRFGFGR
jgi:Arc/MetJ family transcription regulator